ncbi:hypothetical protein H9Q74_004813 [Fusarium xylarioides]|nr:hypothetical protein H9Q71_008393 [Fusarium xylarioides]KAG5825102.1 hypothetical protein H9Q74_004813 [Fusarium xylarioides]
MFHFLPDYVVGHLDAKELYRVTKRLLTNRIRSSDLIPLAIAFLVTFLYRTIKYIDNTHTARDHLSIPDDTSDRQRDIIQFMDNAGKDCVISFGSQSGAAEDYAIRLAQEGKGRFGLQTMVADLEDYDFDTLDTFPSSKIAIFVLATYGDGEPTDNAIAFFNVITEDTASFSLGEQEKPLNNMRYAAFGLGNRTYEHFNAMVRKSTQALSCLGAQNLTAIGEGDDGMGTREEDFLAWKEVMWSDVASAYRLMEKRQVFQPLYEVQECKIVRPTSKPYLGQLENESTMSGLHNHQIARIVESRELFFAGDRKCLHLELDLTCSGLTYKTGNHVAIWLINSSEEVDALFDVLNLAYVRNEAINIV